MLVLNAPDGTGSFLSGSEKSCKLGYTIEVQFSVNQASYVYKGMEAVSKSNPSKSLADYIQFTDLSADSEKQNGTYKVQIKLLKQSDDIMIRPLCLLLPKVESVTPVFTPSGYDQDSIIKITFNKAVDPQSFGSYECLSIYCDSGDLKTYFDTPYFSNDNTVLNIPPKQDTHILTPDSGQKLDVSVNLDYTNLKDKDGLSITKANAHTYRINDSFGNQQKSKIIIRTVEGMGTFISDGQKECTVGYGFEVQFNVNQADYKFIGLEAVSKTGSESRSDFVSFTNLESDTASGIYKIFIRALKAGDDIVIQPVCLLVPKITSVWPPNDNTSYPQYTPIRVSFNKPIMLSDFSDENGFLKNISIKCESKDLLKTTEQENPFFRSPYLEDEGKTLIIQFSNGNNLFTESSVTTRDIEVTLNLQGITDGIQGENVAFAQNTYSFKYTVNPGQDTDNPSFKKFAIAHTKEDVQNGTNLITMDDFSHYAAKTNYNNDSNIVAVNIHNHHVNKVWIDFAAEDKSSGISKLVIKEQMIRDKNAKAIEGEIYTTEYFNSSGNSYFNDCIEYNFQTFSDGVINLSFYLYDFSEHVIESKIDLVKDSVCSIGAYIYSIISSYYVNGQSSIALDFVIKPNNFYGEQYFIKDLDGTKYVESPFVENQNDSFEYSTKLIKVEYGYSKENLTTMYSEEITNQIEFLNEIGRDFGWCKKYYLTIDYDCSKNLYLICTTKDSAGNTCINEKIVERPNNVISWSETKKIISEQERTVWNYYSDSDDQPSFYCVYENPQGEQNNPFNLGDGNSSLLLQKTYIDDLSDGIYYIYATTNSVYPSFYGRPAVFYNGVLQPENNAVSLTDELIPDFSVTSDDPVLNEGKRHIHIKINENEQLDSSLTYLVQYKKSNETEYKITKEFDFDVDTVYTDYDFRLMICNTSGESIYSEKKSKDLKYDNVSPNFKDNYKVMFLSNTLYIYLECQDDGVGFNKNDNNEIVVKYMTSVASIDEKNIDWINDKNVKSGSIKSFYGLEIPYDGNSNYIYVLISDKEGNACVFKTYISKSAHDLDVEKSNQHTFTISKESLYIPGLTAFYLNDDDEWDVISGGHDKIYECYRQSSSFTLPTEAEESFVKVVSHSLGTDYHYYTTNGTYVDDHAYAYYPVYFYPPSYAAGFTCNLKSYLECADNEIAVFTDKPCLVQTFYCTNNLGDDKTQWISYAIEAKVQQKPESFTYKVPVEEIPTGKYYVTVIHYADGTEKMTDVKQK